MRERRREECAFTQVVAVESVEHRPFVTRPLQIDMDADRVAREQLEHLKKVEPRRARVVRDHEAVRDVELDEIGTRSDSGFERLG